MRLIIFIIVNVITVRIKAASSRRNCVFEQQQLLERLTLSSSLKMQPKLSLPPTSSRGLITVTVSSWVHPILSSNLSRKFKTLLQAITLMAPRHHHSTPLLKKLHWLPISERIKYKVACMCFHAINGSGPTYLSELLHIYTLSRTLRDLRIPACSKSSNTKARLTAFLLSFTLDPMFGIHSHKTSGNAQLLHLLRRAWKPSFFHSTSVPLTSVATSLVRNCISVCACVLMLVCVCVRVCVY